MTPHLKNGEAIHGGKENNIKPGIFIIIEMKLKL